MATFQYIAKDASGNETRGTVEAGDRSSAIAAVRAQGLMPTALGEVNSAASTPAAAPARGKAAKKPAAGGKKRRDRRRSRHKTFDLLESESADA